MTENLLSIVFTLKSTDATSIPLHSGRIAQGAVLAWLQRYKPELAVKMHDHYQRLYTVSGLQGALKKDGRWLKVAKGESLWFRFTALHPEIIDAFLEIAAREEPGPGFDDERLQPGAVLAPPVEHESVSITSFEQLAAGSERLADAGDISTDVSLRFLSPTCFIENGQSLPLPVPRYVFGNLFNQWQNASPFPLPVEEVGHFIENIHLVYTSLKTDTVDFKKFRRVGYEGVARFGLHPKMPVLYRMVLQLLAEFAFYAGVGSHTAMGLGQTVREAR
jgi:CRISPR-associated endoribonuclease Cas6